jgi:hypothetical protein
MSSPVFGRSHLATVTTASDPVLQGRSVAVQVGQFFFLPVSPVPCLLSPVPAAILSINCGPLLAVHRLPPVLRFLFFRPFDFAHRAFAALRAILCRSSADNFFSLALTDLRPISEKYFRRLFEITHVSLSCSTAQHHENAGPSHLHIESNLTSLN